MYTRMLVPLDGSETAEKVLPYARSLAGSLKIPIELLAVIEISRYVSVEKNRYLDTFIDAGIRRNQEYLQRIAKTFPGSAVDYTVEGGVPEEVIIAKAADKGTLITMATHGRSGVNRWLLGSITEKILRGSHNHLLVVRANEEAKAVDKTTLYSVMVPLDGSEQAETALPIATELAKAMNLQVVVLRAYSVNIPYSGDYLPEVGELEAQSQKEAISYLDSKVRQLKSEGLVHVFPLASEGEPAETIIEWARGSPNSLIAMCTHGRSGVKRWALGSITEKVVRHSDSPVLVVRAK
ncbi:MAG TPA: universal stress protein [Candidatus Binatia bacterium]|nr:universal stress protein [Candidatus Binatia bacterium]